MAGLVGRWCGAVHQFGLDTVRLQNYCSIPYLMSVNSIFCFVCFYASREVQFRVLYGLIGFILCTDLLLVDKGGKNVVLFFLHWLFAHYLRSLSVALFALSIHSLGQDDGHEQNAFFASLFAVSCLVFSPFYHHRQLNAKIVQFVRKLGDAIKQLLARFVVRPLILLWDWLKFLLLLRWLPMFGSRLRSWALALFDWLDARIFSPLCQFGRQLKSWLLYFLLLHWCIDLWRLAKRVLLHPLCVQLGHLLDGFVYIFGCYWLKPLLVRIGRALAEITKSGVRLFGRVSLSLASFAFEHFLWPLMLSASDHLAQLGLFLHDNAIRPLFAILLRKYRLVEDVVLVNILGPMLKRALDSLPQRNPFEAESDHELDEFMPEMGGEEEGDLGAAEEEERAMASNNARLLELPEMGGGGDDRSSMSTQLSIDEEECALATGLRRIDISESDSDTDAFLPSAFRRRKTTKCADSSVPSGC